MIDSHHIYPDILSLRPLDALDILQRQAQKLLGSEYLMAAAKGLDFGKYAVQRLHAYRHGIGIIDDPGLRAVFPDGCGKFFKHRNRAQRPHKAPRSRGIPNGLVNTEFFRGMDIAFHFVKGARHNGNHYEIRPCQRLLHSFHRFIIPRGSAFLQVLHFVADAFISGRSFPVDIIQEYTAAHILSSCQVTHKPPCPAAGASPDIGDFNVLRSVVRIPHNTHPPNIFSLFSNCPTASHLLSDSIILARKK